MRRFCLLLTLLMLAAVPVRAQGLPAGVIIAAETYNQTSGKIDYCYVPGGTTCTSTGAPGALTLSRGAALTFVHPGGSQSEHHSVTSFKTDPVTKKPLFNSGLIGPAEYADVKGVSTLAPGTYTFYCIKHQWERGALVIE